MDKNNGVRGLGPVAIRRALIVLRRSAFPACVPLVLTCFAVGAAFIGIGWWSSLPAVLPGDEFYALGRVAELTANTLLTTPLPPDAPPTSPLTTFGLYTAIAAIVLLACGAVLRVLRETIQHSLIGNARDLRVVYADDEAGHVVAESDSAFTTVRLSAAGAGAPGTAHATASLDRRFLEGTLPRSAGQVREVLALGSDAESNIGLARRVSALRRADKQQAALPIDKLRMRIDSRALRWSIGRDGFAEFAGAAADIRLTSLPAARSRRLLREQPPNKVRAQLPGMRPALVIIGLQETGLELLARVCAQAQSPALDPLVLVIVDAEANAIARDLLESCPALALAVELHALSLESAFAQSAGTLLTRLAAQQLVATTIYLALEEKPLSDAWERELSAADRATGGPSALVLPVRFPRAGTTERTLLAEEELLDALPRQLHAEYLRQLQAQGREGATAAAVPWQSLPFDYQEDNRSSVDHIWTKARDLGLQIGEPASGATALQRADIEPLAQAEHRRWVASRALTGWRAAEVRAEDARFHPSLVPWTDLGEEERKKDSDFVRRIPAALAAGGLGLRHLVPVAVARGHLPGLEVEKIVMSVRSGDGETGMPNIPLLLIAIESAEDFRCAAMLSRRSDVAVALIVAQSLAGLAVAAGESPQAGAVLAEAAWTITLTSADQIDSLLQQAAPAGLRE
jgi:hypothetical protein